eukprot:5328945-Prymnesium_polylepis.1
MPGAWGGERDTSRTGVGQERMIPHFVTHHLAHPTALNNSNNTSTCTCSMSPAAGAIPSALAGVASSV